MILRWVLVVGFVLLLLSGGFVAYSLLVANPKVAEALRNQPDGERAGIVMLLTLPSGKEIPVNYLREGDLVFAGADGLWWREFERGDGRATLFIRGESLSATGRVVLDDPDYVSDVFERLRPTVPTWLPDWLNGKLVVFELVEAS